MKKTVFFAIKLAVSIGLVALLVRQVDWVKIGEELSTASPVFMMIALLCYVSGIVISIGRWRETARFKRLALPFRDALRYHFAGLFLNNFFPSTLGGDAYRSYQLGRQEGRYAAAASTVLFVRFVGLWATIALFLGFGAISLEKVFGQAIFWSFGIGLGIFLLLDIFITVYWGNAKIQKFFTIFPKRFQSFFSEVGGYANKKFLWESFLVSLAFSLIGVGFFNLALFWALGEYVPIFPYLSVVFLVSVISSVPVSVNNIGIKEWAYYTFFPAVGISPEAALAVALLGRFLQMFASLFGIPAYLQEKDRGRDA